MDYKSARKIVASHALVAKKGFVPMLLSTRYSAVSSETRSLVRPDILTRMVRPLTLLGAMGSLVLLWVLPAHAAEANATRATEASVAAVADVDALQRGGDISGFVRDGDTLVGLANARVHLQAEPEPFVLTAADGSFSFPTNAAAVEITASLPYLRGGALNYATGGVNASSGDSGVMIDLTPLPAAENLTYVPPAAVECAACHFPIYDDWTTSSHARAATNEWVLDLFSGTGTPGGSNGYVYRDTHDPGETGFCATCHAPLADVFDPGNVMLDEVTGSALDGINCVACHQIDSVEGDVNALHHLGSATYRFPEEVAGNSTEYWVWGPLDDVTASIMKAVPGPHFKDPRLCASCHQYTNPDTGAPGQSTYEEWLASPWAQPGPNYRTCQDCHEPASPVDDIACTTDPVVRPGEQIRSHLFEGATPPQLEQAFRLDATSVVNGGVVQVDVEVENVGAGHSFPTGISLRNGLLVVEALFRGLPLPQEQGSVLPFYASDNVPGVQPGDLAGLAGKGYARVLEGRINGMGATVFPVLFIDAEGVYSDTRLASGTTDQQSFGFTLPADAEVGEEVEITVRLLYRRAYRATAVSKGWELTPGGFPIETEIARQELRGMVTGSPVEIPVADPRVLLLFAVVLVWFSVRRIR